MTVPILVAAGIAFAAGGSEVRPSEPPKRPLPAPRAACMCGPDAPSTWGPYNRHVRWHRSLDEARSLAEDQGKLVFTYHVVGNLDDEGC